MAQLARVPFSSTCKRAEDGEVYMSAANHGEGIGGGEITGAGKFGDGFPCRR